MTIVHLKSSYRFGYKKTSAKNSLKCCIIAREEGKPGNEAKHELSDEKLPRLEILTL